MNKVYQRRIDAKKGDCMQAAMATIFNETYENTPDFINMGDEWYSEFYKFAESKGYEVAETLYNEFYGDLFSPTGMCFNEKKVSPEYKLTSDNLKSYGGVDGLFYAVVLSPKYFNWGEGIRRMHAVVCDSEMNIVHDPSPSYQNILMYPLANMIGCNGIMYVECFKKQK